LTRANHFIVFIYRIVSLSPEAKSFGIKRLENISDAREMCHFLLTITKKLEFNKPATKELIRTSYKIRSSILSFFSLFYQNNYVYNTPKPIVERTGNDEYFIDLTQLTRVLLNMEIDFDAGEVEDTFFLEGHRDVYNGDEVEDLLDDYCNQDNYKYKEEVQMVTGGKILEQLREQIQRDTGIICSGFF
jgi:nucleotidyltransferase/DNA polymerase involved in DNA repair